MKLYGKELDDELAKRRQTREERRKQRLTAREWASKNGTRAINVLEWESGYDICPHEEYEDMLIGVPMPKFIFKQCKKCGKVEEDSMEKVSETNLEKTYEIMQRIMAKGKEDLDRK
jgi:hypothetical protein